MQQLNKYTARQSPGGDDASFALSKALNGWLEEFGGEIVQNCASCKHMTKSGPAICTKFNATPPVATIVAGCPEYADELEIPF